MGWRSVSAGIPRAPLEAVPPIQPVPERREELSGWGLHPVETCRVFRPEGLEELQGLVANTRHSLVARGLGRSYGDAALNPEGVLLAGRLDRLLGFEPTTGLLHCEAGVSLAEIIEVFLPRGFWFPVTPGSKHVSVGGAIAADVHGKNHHRSGSMSAFVEDFLMVLGSGEAVACSREQNPEIFWATFGGMGLTGVVVEARLRLRSIETAYMNVEVNRARDLDSILELSQGDSGFEYAVAWIDCMASGRSLGRSVLLRANHAGLGDLPAARAAAPFAAAPVLQPQVPFTMPNALLNSWTVRAFNEGFYRFHSDGAKLQSCEAYFYVLDRVKGWNQVYGRRGLLQYQVWLPFETAREGLVELLETFAGQRRASFLAVLKSFGPASEGLLSFPGPGFTLSLDLPYSGPDLAAVLRRLDQGVARRGGRVYLAKDACLEPECFAEMYPGASRFREVKAEIDPEGRFASSQARRLGLVESD
ncbi:MAG: FAD-binding oxidoreductase [Deltaproteobacteria bacterium]|nr:FAD-binding oxidoreductase [Deltaproteobacteria bacterium]